MLHLLPGKVNNLQTLGVDVPTPIQQADTSAYFSISSLRRGDQIPKHTDSAQAFVR